MHRSHLLLLSIFVLFHPPVGGQILTLRNYTLQDGLPSNRIQFLFQDGKGYIWVGTDGGLSMYDGEKFTTYTVADGLPHNLLYCMIESRKSPGTFFVGVYQGGVGKLHDGKFTTYRVSDIDTANYVFSLLEDSSGVLWCGTLDGLHRLRDGVGSRLASVTERALHAALLPLPDGRICFASGTRVYFYSQDGRLLNSCSVSRSSRYSITSVAMDSSGGIWVGGDDSSLVVVRDGRVEARYFLPDYPDVIAFDQHRNELLIGAGSLWIIPLDRPAAREAWMQYTAENGLPKSRFFAIMTDREDNLWLGSWAKGIAKLSNRYCYRFPFPDVYLASGVVDKRGHLWVVSGEGVKEVWVDEFGKWKTHTHAAKEFGQEPVVGNIALDRQGRLWAVSRSHAPVRFRIQHQARGPARLVEDLSLGSAYPWSSALPLLLYVDHSDRLWVSLQEVGVALFEVTGKSPPSLARMLHQVRDLPITSIRAIHQDRAGNVWLGGFGDGLVMIAGNNGAFGAIHHFTTEQGLPDNGVRAIFQTADGEIWVGTRYGGMAVFEGRDFRALTMKDGLISNAVWDIAQDSSGTIWIATSSGIQAIDPGPPLQLRDQGEFRGDAYSHVGFTENKAVWGITFLDVRVLDLRKMRPNMVPPPVDITSVFVNGEAVSLREPLDLPAERNHVQIQYSGLSFTDERLVRFRYKLEGIDADWSEPTTQRSVTFAALPPGTYTFAVHAINNNNIPSTKPQRFSFVIHPPFWRQWWFLALAAAVAVAAGTMIVRARVRRLLEIERIRTRIATDLHDDIGASLTRITLFSAAAQQELRKQRIDPAPAGSLQGLLSEISVTSRDLVEAMSDVVWSVDPRNDSFDNLVLRMKTYAGRALEAKGVEYDIDIPPEVTTLTLPLDFRRNFFLVFKEALNNLVRHADARNVRLAIHREGKDLVMTLADDGKGFSEQPVSGNGMRNMHKRAEQLHGALDLSSEPGGGTVITLHARIP